MSLKGRLKPSGLPDRATIITGAAAVVLLVLVYLPSLLSWFDPQEFISILNPLRSGSSLGEYLTEA